MPDMSGDELARRVAELRPDIPALFVSGYADADMLGPGQLAERRQLLSKPFAVDDLDGRVRALRGAPPWRS
jgi:CheY-like chemotaxis protein